MRYVIDPGKERRTINFVDNIPFSQVTDLEGKPLTLYMSLMLQNGNSEMRLASGLDDEVSTGRQPVVMFINGAGWRGADKNLMAAEMEYFAEAGYAVACIYYRSSAEGKWPAQLIDCKTAVRFLRSHAEEYNLDADHIAAMGRSAGAHLTAWMVMNTDGYDSEEWAGYSSHVQCGADFFGGVDIKGLNLREQSRFSDPNFRWHSFEETHGGALLGGDMNTVIERSDSADPQFHINPGMAPLVILHGEEDPLVPVSISEAFYDKIVAAGLGDQCDLYIVKHGGHGTRELFQTQCKEIVRKFFDRYLK